MPAETPGAKLPSPWKDFLGEIDKALEKPLEIHCIGGFALAFYYGIPRTTGDIDYYTTVPANLNLEEIAGNGSDLHRRYKIYLHRVTVATLPEEYQERLSKMAGGLFERLTEPIVAAFALIEELLVGGNEGVVMLQASDSWRT